ncbi:Rv1733c family protein [Streptomyces tardus]|uniref:Rv1733c family protein n=1 Tax=Streptomyces tardus TaxID=2780544 RepID=UPI001B3A062B|nr:hypothetical protein [Streptomyces tardus]
MFRAIVGLWRWRRSALCRRTDRAEGWLALGALLLVLVACPLVAAAAGEIAHRKLTETVRSQQLAHQQVWATVEKVLPRRPAGEESEELSHQQQVMASWRAPSGAQRAAQVTVTREVVTGDRFRIWVDMAGALTTRPMSAATASSHAALAGVVMGIVAALAVELVRRQALRLLLRRRLEEWERQWAKVGPDWGRSWPAASS